MNESFRPAADYDFGAKVCEGYWPSVVGMRRHNLRNDTQRLGFDHALAESEARIAASHLKYLQACEARAARPTRTDNMYVVPPPEDFDFDF